MKWLLPISLSLGLISSAYAQINQLPNATLPLSGTEMIAIDQAQGNDFKTVKTIISNIGGGGSGVAGPVGPPGPPGPQGPSGTAGAIGPAGANGANGPMGPAGPVGPKGNTGTAGAAGVAGPQGIQGPQGVKGNTGNTGATGVAGPTGPVGSIGPAGPAGADGTDGTDGAPGPTGIAGPPGPANEVADNATLATTLITAFPNGVVRRDHTAGRGATPLHFVPATGTCAANGLANDGGSCVNTSGGNSWKARPSDSSLHSLQFNNIDATGGVTSDNSAGLNALCAALNTSPYRHAVIDPGTYRLKASVVCTQTADWNIRWHGSARFLGDPVLQSNALYITDSPANSHTLDLWQPYIDMSTATCPGGTCAFQATTAIYTDLHLRATLHQPRLVGAATYNNVNATNGWTPTRTVQSEIFGGSISGFAAGGIYASGDLIANSPKSIYNLVVLGTRFAHNGEGVQCKFLINTCKIIGAEFFFNQGDIGCFWAGAPDIEPPCKTLVATGNSHKFTRNHFWSVPGGTSAIITNNFASDLGYNDQPVTANTCGQSPNINATGLLDDGAQGIVFANNKIQYVDCTKITSLPIITVRTGTFNGGASIYGGGAISADNNQISNVDIFLYEQSTPGNTIAPSIFRNTHMGSVSTPFSSSNGTIAGTIFDYTDALTGKFTHTVGGLVVGYIAKVDAQSLAAFGTLTASAGTGTPILVSMAGVLAGDTVVLTPTTATLTQNAGVVLRALAQAGQVQIHAYNATGTSFDFAATPSRVRIEVLRGN